MSKRQRETSLDAQSPEDAPKAGLGARPPASHAQAPESDAQKRKSVKLHPLLRSMAALPQASKPSAAGRATFDATSLNPYINQSDVSAPQHRRPLKINPQGVFIQKADKIRLKAEQERQQQQQLREKEIKGILPDANIQEQLYQPRMPPLVEWWDRPYLGTRSYEAFDRKVQRQFVYDDENSPVSVYIQHPVPIPAPNPSGVVDKVYLTKKEMKRKRKIERQAKHQDLQDRIRLGLEPAPAPKVKLSNLMNVLTNEAINDPTGIEMKVRQEVQDRYDKHMQTNEARKLTPEQRHEKTHLSHEKDKAQGLFTTVYKVADLSDGGHFFKVDMNAKQLELVGICLQNPKFNLVIVEGGAKSIKFYKKLMTKRIRWTEATPRKDGSSAGDLSGNSCQVLWEGEISRLSYMKWSIMYTKDDEDAYKVLNKFGHENYWREASAGSQPK